MDKYNRLVQFACDFGSVIQSYEVAFGGHSCAAEHYDVVGGELCRGIVFPRCIFAETAMHVEWEWGECKDVYYNRYYPK